MSEAAFFGAWFRLRTFFDLEEQTMKKSLWLVLALMLACVLALSACDNGTDQPQNPNTEQSTNQPSDNNGETTDTNNTQPPSTDNTKCQHTFGDWETIKQAKSPSAESVKALGRWVTSIKNMLF